MVGEEITRGKRARVAPLRGFERTPSKLGIARELRLDATNEIGLRRQRRLSRGVIDLFEHRAPNGLAAVRRRPDRGHRNAQLGLWVAGPHRRRFRRPHIG